MTLWPGDTVGGRFKAVRMVAYQGNPDCTYAGCRRRGGDWTKTPPDYGECGGWHCSLCDAPCSMMGHDCPRAGDAA